VEKFIEWVKENELIHKYGVTPMQHINATGGGSFKYAKTIQEKLNIRVFTNESAKKKNKKKARDKILITFFSFKKFSYRNRMK